MIKKVQCDTKFFSLIRNIVRFLMGKKPIHQRIYRNFYFYFLDILAYIILIAKLSSDTSL